ncbi:MAG: hypothetical protein COA44_06990 [Arcobacter sp.]|nr:MAG: hypothetical protein COA44_06990 [Arcobacter sp.]
MTTSKKDTLVTSSGDYERFKYSPFSNEHRRN